MAGRGPNDRQGVCPECRQEYRPVQYSCSTLTPRHRGRMQPHGCRRPPAKLVNPAMAEQYPNTPTFVTVPVGDRWRRLRDARGKARTQFDQLREELIALGFCEGWWIGARRVEGGLQRVVRSVGEFFGVFEPFGIEVCSGDDSRSTDTSRLCRGYLPPDPAPPGPGCPGCTVLLRQEQRQRSFTYSSQRGRHGALGNS